MPRGSIKQNQTLVLFGGHSVIEPTIKRQTRKSRETHQAEGPPRPYHEHLVQVLLEGVHVAAGRPWAVREPQQHELVVLLHQQAALQHLLALPHQLRGTVTSSVTASIPTGPRVGFHPLPTYILENSETGKPASEKPETFSRF